MATMQETKRPPLSKFNPVMIVSAYGFVIAIASLLFFYIGFRIDQYFGTAPNFMFGMFFLALFLTIGRLYQEAWLRRKEV